MVEAAAICDLGSAAVIANKKPIGSTPRAGKSHRELPPAHLAAIRSHLGATDFFNGVITNGRCPARSKRGNVVSLLRAATRSAGF